MVSSDHSEYDFISQKFLANLFENRLFVEVFYIIDLSIAMSDNGYYSLDIVAFL